MADRVEVEGVPALKRNFAACARDVERETEQATAKPAGAIRTATAAAQPVLSGRLRSSVRVDSVRGGHAVELGAGLAYAGWIEYGGSRGRPFVAGGRTLVPALESNEDAAVREVDRAVDKVTGKYSG
jgi:Bacteriophage HK97-gp10, putative tail-component